MKTTAGKNPAPVMMIKKYKGVDFMESGFMGAGFLPAVRIQHSSCLEPLSFCIVYGIFDILSKYVIVKL